MKTALFLSLLLPLNLLAQSPVWQQAKSYSATVDMTNTAVVKAPGNGYFLTGYFTGTATFDGLTLSANTESGYLLKVDCDFKAEWVKIVGSRCNYAAVDPQGNVFAAGEKQGKTYLAKYDAGGQLLGEFSAQSGSNKAKFVCVDAQGFCYAGGDANSTSTYGTHTLTHNGGRSCYLLKLSPNLQQVEWALHLANTANRYDELTDLEIDRANGFIYACGNYNQKNSWGTYSGDFFVAKRETATGNLQWQSVFTAGSGTRTIQTLALDPSGQTLYTAGGYKNTTVIPPNITLNTNASGGAYHVFLASLKTSTGAANWAKSIATGDNYPKAMVWRNNKLYLHGAYNSSYGTETWGNFTLAGAEPFLAEIEASGAVSFAEQFQGIGSGNGAPSTPGAGSGNGLESAGAALVVSGKRVSTGTGQIGNLNLSPATDAIYLARKTFSAGTQPLTATPGTIKHIQCPGEQNGSAAVVVQGGAPPYTYAWSTGASTSSVDMLGAGTYRVTVSDGLCNVQVLEIVLEIKDLTPPVLICPANRTICEGVIVEYPLPQASDNCDLNGAQPMLVAGLPSGQAFPVGAQILRFELTDAAGNKASCSFTVNVGKQPAADAGPDQLLDCAHPAVTLGSAPEPNMQYLWSGPGINQANKNQAAPVVSAPGTYILLVTNPNFGCSDLDTAQVTSSTGGNLAPADAGADQVVCTEAVLLSANQPDGTSGRWTASPGVSLDNAAMPDAEATGLAPGANLFVWTLSNTLCPDYDSDTLLIFFENKPPEAVDDLETAAYDPGTLVLFLLNNDLLTGTPAAKARLLDTPSDGGSWSLTSEGRLTVELPANFSGKLEARYALCSAACPALCDTASIRLDVAEPDLSAGPPNVITPNGDGLNERLIFRQLETRPQDFAGNSIVIFNRWGQPVFEAKPYLNNWDGRGPNGAPLPEGAYYYLLQLPSEMPPYIRGTVTVLR